MGVDVTVLSPHPTFPTGSFPKTWRLSRRRTVDGVQSINLWNWQPSSQDPGFLSRMAYYLIFPLHAALWSSVHYRSYDVIITSAPPLFAHITGTFAKTLFRKPLIVEVRDLWIDGSISLGFLRKGSLYERLSRGLEHDALQSADRIMVTTDELGRRLSPEPSIQKKIRWLPNGVDTSFFQPSNGSKIDRLIYAGNIGHAQDLENVILSLKIILQKRELGLCIVGDGDIRSHLMKLVETEGLSDYVSFPGLVEREAVPSLLSESLIGLAPLKNLETLEYAAPTKAYEYMACGIPFLGCGRGEIESIAQDSGAGVIAENTPEAIADAILGLLSDPERMAEMGRSGRAYVIQHYDRKAIAERLIHYLEEVADDS
jgi:glycosyltransferase involved in cell wall biosynthesis